MVLGWRRAFCTTIPKDQRKDSPPIIKEKPDPNPSPRLRTRLGGFFSNPSTPRMERSGPTVLRCKTGSVLAQPGDHNSAPQSPKLRCKTSNNGNNNYDNSPRLLFNRSTPSSPGSPSAFCLLKSSIRLSKSRCGICLQCVKTGQGTAIFTAECGHVFHFPCIVVHVKEQCTLTCPVCRSTWKEMHLLNFNSSSNGGGNINQTSSTDITKHHQQRVEAGHEPPHVSPNSKRSAVLKVYNDDEPLNSPTCGARFYAIPESEEDEENDEFPGFFVGNKSNNPRKRYVFEEGNDNNDSNMEFQVLSEAAIVSVGKTSETYAVVLKVRAPSASSRRAPIDLVMVANVSSSVVTVEKLHAMKRAMRTVISSLSSSDRLSLVAFSTTSKRLLPLRRMTASGKRSARRIVDAVATIDGAAASATDSLKKAAKVIEDRREKNPATAIILFSDGGHGGDPLVSSTRFSNPEVPVHTVNLSACVHAPDLFPERVTGLLSQVVLDLRVQLSLVAGSGPGEISAVYSYTDRPVYVGSGSGWLRVGDLGSEEERELLVELKVPTSHGGAQRMMSVRCCHKGPLKEVFHSNDRRPLVIPRARENQRLRCLFVATRAVAESRRLVERNDVAGAHHMLASARAVVRGSGWGSGEEFVRGLDAELAHLNCKRRTNTINNYCNNNDREAKAAEPLTPTSAWRAAERLAKVAIMRKSLNRVSDLHGFENARF